jgi:hypothetical protein
MNNKPKSIGARAALRAMREAVDEVVTTHRKLGLPLYIERKGKIVGIKAVSGKLRSVREHCSGTD